MNNTSNLKELSYIDFIQYISDKTGVELYKKYELDSNGIKNKIRLRKFIKSQASIIKIIDINGVSHKYRIETTTNNGKSHTITNKEQLANAVRLEVVGLKPFDEIIKDSGIKIQIKKVRICEGGGWSSSGTRYTWQKYNVCVEF